MSRAPEYDNKISDEFPDLEPATPFHSKRSGGPKTAEGKARSSENRTSHGMCSGRLILPGEDPDEYAQIKEGWFSDYNPSAFSSHTLTTNVVNSHWFLIRTQRRCNEIELALSQKSPIDWTDRDHRNLTNFMRYRTSAERTFHRNFAALEKQRSTRIRERQADERLRLKALATAAKIEADALKSANVSNAVQSKQSAGQAKQAAAQPHNDLPTKEWIEKEWTNDRQSAELQTDDDTAEFLRERGRPIH